MQKLWIVPKKVSSSRCRTTRGSTPERLQQGGANPALEFARSVVGVGHHDKPRQQIIATIFCDRYDPIDHSTRFAGSGTCDDRKILVDFGAEPLPCRLICEV